MLFDPAAQRVIRQADLHHTSDFTPYEGMAVTGAVRTVLVRGEDVIRDGRHVGSRGQGRYVARSADLRVQPATSRPRRGSGGGGCVRVTSRR